MPDPFFLLDVAHAFMKSVLVLFVFGLLLRLGGIVN